METEIDEDHQYKEQNRPYLDSTDIGRNILISDIGRNILITGSRIDKIIFEHTSLWRGVAEIQIRDRRRSPRYKLRFIKKKHIWAISIQTWLNLDLKVLTIFISDFS